MRLYTRKKLMRQFLLSPITAILIFERHIAARVSLDARTMTRVLQPQFSRDVENIELPVIDKL